jgi:2-oxoisovalerate dehydrogenase E1 component alpha subunit
LHSRVVADVGAKAWNLHFAPGHVFTEDLDFRLGTEGGATPLFRILDLEGNVVNPNYMPDLTADQCRNLMENMVRSHMMDVTLFDAQRQGRLSFHMTQFGEEGVITAAAAALDATDVVYAQYREAGLLMWRGYPIKAMLAQCLGTHEDQGKGRQMPIHYGSPQLHFQTVSSPLATQLPQAAGAGYALKLEGQDRVVCCFFGEGAASEGDCHAGMNFAATLGGQTLFLCRNNGFAISTPAAEQYKGDGIYARGLGYGMRCIRVDGNDLLACYVAVAKARALILEHRAPVLLEAMTYRGGHHSTSDDSTRYRSKGEMDFWLQNLSPMRRFGKFCELNGYWTQGDSERVRQETRSEVVAALEDAEAQAKWPADTLFDDVYHELPPHLQQQKNELVQHLQSYASEYPSLGPGTAH